MKLYHYKLCDKDGQIITGAMTANSKNDVLSHFAQMPYTVLAITSLRPKKIFSPAQQLLFCRQLAILLQANISLQDALAILSQSASKKTLPLFFSLHESIAKGFSLSEAIEKSGFFLSPILQNFIKIGQTSGRLDEALKKATIYLSFTRLATEKIKAASIYPIILIIALFISLSAISLLVLPAMNSLLMNLHVPLPYFTRLFINGHVIPLVLSSFLIIFLLLLLFYKKNPLSFYRCFFQLPLLGTLCQEILLFRLCSGLEALLSAGIPIEEASLLLATQNDNCYIEHLLHLASKTLEQGLPLSKAWQEEKSLPPIFLQLITAGEASGNLSNIFSLIIDFYQKDSEILQKKFISLLEPALILIISLFVGSFVMAIVLPLLDAGSQINL